MIKSKKMSDKIAGACIFMVMLAMTLSFIYPLYYIFINALKTKNEFYRDQFALPTFLHLDNFRTIFMDFKIARYFLNSMAISGLSTVLIVFFGLFAGYAFSKLHFRGKATIYILIISTMFLPSQVSMIPAYVMFSRLHIIRTYWPVILSYLAGGLPAAILLMTGAFMGIPNEMIESAKIDGAGYFAVIRSMILPMGMSTVSVVIIFNFIGYWNDLLTPMIYLTDINRQTVMVALTKLVDRSRSLPTLQLAGLMISVLPAMLIYLFLQKYMIKGMVAGAIK